MFVAVVFFLTNWLIPYDYATQFRLQGGIGAVAAVTEQLGLDRPLPIQFFEYLAGLLVGDLGLSYGGESVSAGVWGALPMTIVIFGAGGVLAVLLGSGLGRWMSTARNRPVKSLVATTAVLFTTAFPPWLVFLLVTVGTGPLLAAREVWGLPIDSARIWRESLVSEGQVTALASVALMASLAIALAVRGWAKRRDLRLVSLLAVPLALTGFGFGLHRAGVGPQSLDLFFFRSSVDVGIGSGSPVLAVLAFALLAFGELMFLVQGGVGSELLEDYAFTARAKGLQKRLVRDRHAFRNASLPLLSRSLVGVPYMLTGLVIIERQLSVDGLSAQLFAAVQVVDVPVIVGILVTVGALVLLLRFVLEVTYAKLDPRIRLVGGP